MRLFEFIEEQRAVFNALQRPPEKTDLAHRVADQLLDRRLILVL